MDVAQDFLGATSPAGDLCGRWRPCLASLGPRLAAGGTLYTQPIGLCLACTLAQIPHLPQVRSASDWTRCAATCFCPGHQCLVRGMWWCPKTQRHQEPQSPKGLTAQPFPPPVARQSGHVTALVQGIGGLGSWETLQLSCCPQLQQTGVCGTQRLLPHCSASRREGYGVTALFCTHYSAGPKFSSHIQKNELTQTTGE